MARRRHARDQKAFRELTENLARAVNRRGRACGSRVAAKIKNKHVTWWSLEADLATQRWAMHAAVSRTLLARVRS